MNQQSWWRGAIIYQIYPRSLKDTNGDGIGDLPGIIEKLDYISDLGVDAIWISPFFKSPMKDFVFDISDYRAVDPIFGTLVDFDRLIEKAHSLKIKVIIDQVLSHTSDQHDWFVESRQDKQNSKADWYVWADAREDGTPPNNWLSIFGGGAWQWEPRRKQYYLHNFLTSQPDLNFHNPKVQQATLDNIEFWLKRGVDGFRLDAINFCFHDAQLRDNPAKPSELRLGRGFSEDNPYAFQFHHFNNTQPENIHFIEDIRTLLDRYPGAAALGEISSEDSLATMAEYTSGEERLHMGYSFELLTDDFSATYIRETVEKLEQKMSNGWPCWAISNHDVKRVMSRWNPADHSVEKAKLFNALLCSLKGSICSFQGEELGLCEAELEYSQLQDPYGINVWPTYKGRDGCRTPMPWKVDQQNSGFSSVTPWLPVAVNHFGKSVETQRADPQSVLNSYTQFIKWRKQKLAVMLGEIEFLDVPEPVIGFKRTYKNKGIIFIFNLSNNLQVFDFKNEGGFEPDRSHGIVSGNYTGDQINLPPYACFIAEEIS
jgi:alpha-glucosidase